MKKNMGGLDRILRILGAALLVILFFTDVITGTWGIIALIVAGMFILTSLFSFCPLYLPFRISTLRKNGK
jgi:membrane-bound ClpP family serine protease